MSSTARVRTSGKGGGEERGVEKVWGGRETEYERGGGR